TAYLRPSTALREKLREDKVSTKFSLHPEPLLCFSLCIGSLSQIQCFSHFKNLDSLELKASKREFIQANVVVKMQKRVFLPKIIERFTKNASLNSDNSTRWFIDNADEKLWELIQKCVEGRPNYKKASQVVVRYDFSKDFMEKIAL
ncbi:hypothetical protein EUTSA_v10026966mg, partial [Eutrema salsugineum]